ncbi:MAG: radical SAM protein [archaeon]
MRAIINTPFCSKRISTLPEGCRRCVTGEKTVVFVTGLCGRSCFYCPVSEQKFKKDVIYANEWPIKNPAELIEEARLCDSTGAGITGGDPLVKLDRTIDFILRLKKAFGKGFHIHLYTPLELVTSDRLARLYEAGLDEIRFQPDQDDDKLWPRLALPVAFDWDVVVEIPGIPGYTSKAKKLIRFIDDVGIRYLNINELEISDTNAQHLLDRGLVPKDDISYGVKGSEEMAEKLLAYCAEKTKLHVHYCTTTLKDRVQLANRIKRRAKNVAAAFDRVTREGMLVRGAVYDERTFPGTGQKAKLEKHAQAANRRLAYLKERLIKQGLLTRDLVALDRPRGRLLMSEKDIRRLRGDLEGFIPTLVTEYPTHDHMLVELDQLS